MFMRQPVEQPSIRLHAPNNRRFSAKPLYAFLNINISAAAVSHPPIFYDQQLAILIGGRKLVGLVVSI
jgi:ABC-type uncharacterized transport system substrate-binding protein